MTRADLAMAAALAAHRFGLGERDLRPLGADPQGWLLAQIGSAEPQHGAGLVGGAEGVRRFAEFQREQRQPRAGAPAMAAAPPAPTADPVMAGTETARNAEALFVRHFLAITQADVRARLATAATTQRPFNERLALVAIVVHTMCERSHGQLLGPLTARSDPLRSRAPA